MFNDGSNVVMPVAPAYGGGNGFFGDGDFGGFILGLLFGGLGGWGGFGGFGGGWGNMMGWEAMFPYFFNAQTQNDVNRGFGDLSLSNQIASLQGSIDNVRTDGMLSDIQNSINNGFASMEVANCNRAMDAMQTQYQNEIANLERSFASQTANAQGFNNLQSQLAECCCANRIATIETNNTVQTEGASTRLAIQNQTQAILDKLCQLELDGYKQQLDAKNDIIAQLRQENLYSRGQASQVAQTAELRQSGATQLNQLVSELRSCPIPAQPVYGSQPIFTCGGNGCGCNNF